MRTRSKVIGVSLLAVVLAIAYGSYWFLRSAENRQSAIVKTQGDPNKAPPILIANGCAGCHTIPGIPGAYGKAGPRLDGLADRIYIAGSLVNSPDNLIHWIRDARAINPHTAMPSTHVTESEARDMAAYLYSLR
jgi:cytochrome c1